MKWNWKCCGVSVGVRWCGSDRPPVNGRKNRLARYPVMLSWNCFGFWQPWMLFFRFWGLCGHVGCY